MAGYRHPDYTKSLAEIGTPLALARSKGWIIKRAIPDSLYQDGMGPYPLFACENWYGLKNDLEELRRHVIALSIVTDPFGEYDLPYLRHCFRDRVIPFKQHLIVDLSVPMASYISSHHRRYARKGLACLRIARCEDTAQVIDDWVNLYTDLIKRHKIEGISAFSRQAFTRQLRVPGMNVFRAQFNQKTVGMLLWFADDRMAYYHLGAFSDTGYQRHASFALFWHAITYFADRSYRNLDLGAGAGLLNDDRDGLYRFKRGWATGSRPVYFCGRIFNKNAYEAILKESGMPRTAFFPAYRCGEFG